MKCVACGCTDNDCRGCIERTGAPCSWAEPRICSACTGNSLIKIERARQVEEEGYNEAHDDAHYLGEIRRAADCYALEPAKRVLECRRFERETARGLADPDRPVTVRRKVPKRWPWGAQWWKPSRDRVRELVKAGALYVAEAERLKRGGWTGFGTYYGKANACARKIDRIHRQKIKKLAARRTSK